MTKKIVCETCAVLLTLLIALSPIRAVAAELENDCEVKVSRLDINEETGLYCFDVCVRADELFAGTDVGVYCSQDTQILTVQNEAANCVGPTSANGLIWFGCFDGNNTLSEATFTVSGSFDPMRESAVKISDVKLHRIEDGEYLSVPLNMEIIIELRADNTNFMTGEKAPEPEENNKTGYIVGSLAFLAVVVLAVIAHIYITKTKRRNSIENQ